MMDTDRVKDHRNLLDYSPLLKKPCVGTCCYIISASGVRQAKPWPKGLRCERHAPGGMNCPIRSAMRKPCVCLTNRLVSSAREADYLCQADNRTTVGFHNFRLFQFESLKSEQINCGCFIDTMSDFNVPGSGPKKHDEISEIDRTASFVFYGVNAAKLMCLSNAAKLTC